VYFLSMRALPFISKNYYSSKKDYLGVLMSMMETSMGRLG